MKKIFTLLLLFHVALICSAAGISKSKAIATARQFMQSRQLTADKQSAEFSSSSLTSTTLFDGTMMAVNSPSAGFVLVAGDDDNEVVLGYSDKGAFDFNNAPEHIKAWLQGYADQLKVAGSAAFAKRTPMMKATTSKTSVSPLITTRWNQGEPFNNNCYMTWDGDADYKCATGCVATAMAQVINYHKWPTDNVAEMSSYKPYSNTTVAALPAATMDWANMLNEYVSGHYTPEQAAAVAQLMRYCGQSVKMQYGQKESGAIPTEIDNALVDVFHYSTSTRFIMRDYYTIEGWDNIIYGELAANRPVIYGGQSSGGGHSFVVDGYDNGYYHVNWGWGGMNDGYFLLSILNPGSNSGIGASSSTDGYSFQQTAVIGIQKASDEPDCGILSLTKNFAVSGSNYTVMAYNLTTKPNTFDYGYTIENASGDVVATTKTGSNHIACNYGYDVCIPTSVLTSLANGSYKAYAVFRLSSSEGQWNKCDGSDLYYLSFTVSGGALSDVQTNHSALTSDVTITGYVNKGDGQSCHPQNLEVTFSNASVYDYNQQVKFCFDGTEKSMAGLVVPGNGTATISFDFMPLTAGDHTFAVKQGETQIGTGTITITDSGIVATNWFAVCQFSNMEVLDLDGDKNVMFSNNCEAKITFYNPTNATSSKSLRIAVFNNGVDCGGANSDVTLSAGASVSGNYTINGTGVLDTFQWIVKDNADNRILSSTDIINCRGGKAVDANGKKYYIIESSIIPASATSVDFTYVNKSIPASVTPSSNANCVYYLTAGATTPSWLSGKNVVKGNVAETLTLTDAGDFNPAKNFTAQTVTFTQSFTGTNGTGSGWNTIVLPFEATSVKNGTNDISWFTGTSDTGKDFWLYSFSGESAGNVNFSHVSGTSVPAHTPLLIAVPDATWGAEKNLAGKTITFSATNAAIVAGKQSVANGTNYKMQGTFCSKTASDIYVLNAEGSKFQKGSSATATPFTAYFTSLSTSSSLHSLGISIDGGSPTGISEVKQAVNDSSATYNIMGQRTNIRKGIIIVNGKKMVVK